MDDDDAGTDTGSPADTDSGRAGHEGERLTGGHLDGACDDHGSAVDDSRRACRGGGVALDGGLERAGWRLVGGVTPGVVDDAGGEPLEGVTRAGGAGRQGDSLPGHRVARGRGQRDDRGLVDSGGGVVLDGGDDDVRLTIGESTDGVATARVVDDPVAGAQAVVGAHTDGVGGGVDARGGVDGEQLVGVVGLHLAEQGGEGVVHLGQRRGARSVVLLARQRVLGLVALVGLDRVAVLQRAGHGPDQDGAADAGHASAAEREADCDDVADARGVNGHDVGGTDPGAADRGAGVVAHHADVDGHPDTRASGDADPTGDDEDGDGVGGGDDHRLAVVRVGLALVDQGAPTDRGVRGRDEHLGRDGAGDAGECSARAAGRHDEQVLARLGDDGDATAGHRSVADRVGVGERAVGQADQVAAPVGGCVDDGAAPDDRCGVLDEDGDDDGCCGSGAGDADADGAGGADHRGVVGGEHQDVAASVHPGVAGDGGKGGGVHHHDRDGAGDTDPERPGDADRDCQVVLAGTRCDQHVLVGGHDGGEGLGVQVVRRRLGVGVGVEVGVGADPRLGGAGEHGHEHGRGDRHATGQGACAGDEEAAVAAGGGDGDRPAAADLRTGVDVGPGVDRVHGHRGGDLDIDRSGATDGDTGSVDVVEADRYDDDTRARHGREAVVAAVGHVAVLDVVVVDVRGAGAVERLQAVALGGAAVAVPVGQQVDRRASPGEAELDQPVGGVCVDDEVAAAVGQPGERDAVGCVDDLLPVVEPDDRDGVRRRVDVVVGERDGVVGLLGVVAGRPEHDDAGVNGRAAVQSQGRHGAGDRRIGGLVDDTDARGDADADARACREAAADEHDVGQVLRRDDDVAVRCHGRAARDGGGGAHDEDGHPGRDADGHCPCADGACDRHRRHGDVVAGVDDDVTVRVHGDTGADAGLGRRGEHAHVGPDTNGWATADGERAGAADQVVGALGLDDDVGPGVDRGVGERVRGLVGHLCLGGCGDDGHRERACDAGVEPDGSADGEDCGVGVRLRLDHDAPTGRPVDVDDAARPADGVARHRAVARHAGFGREDDVHVRQRSADGAGPARDLTGDRRRQGRAQCADVHGAVGRHP